MGVGRLMVPEVSMSVTVTNSGFAARGSATTALLSVSRDTAAGGTAVPLIAEEGGDELCFTSAAPLLLLPEVPAVELGVGSCIDADTARMLAAAAAMEVAAEDTAASVGRTKKSMGVGTGALD